LYVSAQVPYAADRFKYIGQVGSELTLAEGRDAAVVTARNVLSQIHAARGDIVRLRLQALNYFGAEREIDSAEAAEVFQAMPGANARLLARLTELWKVEAATLGATVWALYNALTHWSSHDPVRLASVPNRAAIVLGREERVRAALQRPAFRRLIT